MQQHGCEKAPVLPGADQLIDLPTKEKTKVSTVYVFTPNLKKISQDRDSKNYIDDNWFAAIEADLNTRLRWIDFLRSSGCQYLMVAGYWADFDQNSYFYLALNDSMVFCFNDGFYVADGFFQLALRIIDKVVKNGNAFHFFTGGSHAQLNCLRCFCFAIH